MWLLAKVMVVVKLADRGTLKSGAVGSGDAALHSRASASSDVSLWGEQPRDETSRSPLALICARGSDPSSRTALPQQSVPFLRRPKSRTHGSGRENHSTENLRDQMAVKWQS